MWTAHGDLGLQAKGEGDLAWGGVQGEEGYHALCLHWPHFRMPFLPLTSPLPQGGLGVFVVLW